MKRTLIFIGHILLLSACGAAPPVQVIEISATLSPSPTDTPTATVTVTPTPRPTQIPAPTATPEPSLKTVASVHGVAIGTAVQSWLLADEEAYRETVIREFNMLTPEWELKFGIIHPGREDWNFGGVDAIVDFAEEYDMQVRGHTLIWFLDMPTWFQNYVGTRDEYIELMREHIYTVVNRYEGRIPVWDVVNEAFDDGGAYRNTIWLRLIGPEYIELAFEFAHEADPDALLFYNDYNIEYRGAKFARVRKMVEDFQAHDVPIHGVGMQMHLGMGHYQPPPEDIALNMAELESLGIQVHITEMDIAITQGQGDIEERLQWQADYYADVAAVCIEAPNCTALVTWGFTDRYTWLHFFRHPTEQPLLFDAEYEPKPSYYRLFDAFAAR